MRLARETVAKPSINKATNTKKETYAKRFRNASETRTLTNKEYEFMNKYEFMHKNSTTFLVQDSLGRFYVSLRNKFRFNATKDPLT